MNKHTAGPWVHDVVKTSSGICHKIGPFPWKDGKQNHACIYADYACSGQLEDELEANAKLITAAPDLLDALDLIAGMHDFEASTGQLAMSMYEASCIARSLIKKATVASYEPN